MNAKAGRGNGRLLHWLAVTSMFGVAISTLGSRPAVALASNPSDAPCVEMALVGHAGTLAGSFSRSTSNDTRESYSAFRSMGLGAELRAGLSPRVSLGVVSQWLFAGSERQNPADGGPGTYSRAGGTALVEARWHYGRAMPSHNRTSLRRFSHFWLSANAGLAAMRDRFAGEVAEPGSAWQWAPAVGVAAGVDYPLAAVMSWGIEFRVTGANFRSEVPTVASLSYPSASGCCPQDAEATRYGSLLAVTFGVALRWASRS